MKVLELAGVKRSYERGIDVLNGVDLTLDRGEVVSLVGRNGAGKTTLIKVLMGLLRPQGGTVRVFDLDPWEEPIAVKRRIGYVSEEQTLPEYLPVSEVLGLHKELFPTWDASLAGEFLDRFQLMPGARIGALSKGQARQVMFLCAIAHRPELLVLDEPAGGLDPVARRDFLEAAITRLNRDGTTILFSSHHMTDVERLAGRIVFIHEGRKILDRDLDALREGYSLAILPQETPLEEARRLPGCVATRRRPDGVHVVLEGDRSGHALSLEDLFIELVEGQPC